MKRRNGLKAMLLLMALFTLAPPCWSKTIKVYVRSLDGTKVGIYAFNRFGLKTTGSDGQSSENWSDGEVYGTSAAQWGELSTDNLGGKTWYVMSYDTDKLHPTNSSFTPDGGTAGTVSGSYFSIQFHNEDNSWTTANPGDNGWGIEYTETLNDLPEELFFIIDHNAIQANPFDTRSKDDNGNSEHGWLGVHEITRAQAVLADGGTRQFNYYLMDEGNNQIAKFDAVRNQNQGIHSMSGNSFAATVWADKLFKNGATTAKFYIKAYYTDPNTDRNASTAYITTAITNSLDGQGSASYYEYRPSEADYDMTPDPNSKDNNEKDWKSKDNCVVRVSGGTNNYFTLTKQNGSDGKLPVSYTILLNTGNYFTSQNDGSIGNQSRTDAGFAQNVAYNDRFIPRRGVGVHPNKEIKDNANISDDNPLYVISNMQDVTRDDNNNQNVNMDDKNWNLTDQYPMQKVDADKLATLIKNHPDLAETGDEVWSVKVNKAGTSALKSIFMAFVSKNDKAELNSSDAATVTAAWNKVIRPFVAEGKDAISTFGGLYRPVNLSNGNQALSPGADDMFYTQCDVYVNLTRSTYYVIPVSGYQLTGPAVQYFNPTTKQWVESSGTSQEYWGNGQSMYWKTAMVYNAEDNCWEYTGKFYQSKAVAEDATDANGNKKDNNIDLYESQEIQWDGNASVSKNSGEGNKTPATQNEQDLEFIDQYGFRIMTNNLYTVNYREDYDHPTSTKHREGVTAYWDGNSTSTSDHEDTYYYNHVVIDPDVDTSVESMANVSTIRSGNNANKERIHNINFSLPTGRYTIKFYPDGDGKDNHPFYKLSKTEDPGNPIPGNHDPDDLSDTYKFLRTYSSITSKKLASDQKCFIVTAYDGATKTATLTSIDFIPANTGVILTYNQREIDKLISSGLAREAVDGIYADFGGYLVLDDLSPDDSITYSKNATLQEALKKNMLRPTTYYDKDNNKVVDGGFQVNASTFKSDDAKKIAYRNYSFSFYKKKSWANYKLGFYRLKSATSASDTRATTSPNRAYLALPAIDTGGETPTTGWDDNITFNKTTMAKAQVFNTFVIDYPDWNDDVTNSIQDISSETKPSVSTVFNGFVYDLAGRKVATAEGLKNGNIRLPKGIYIVNGKKIVIG